MAYHKDILKLEDDGLVKAAILVSEKGSGPELTITPWERKFLSEVPDFWVKAGGLTWKQRRVLRGVLTKVFEGLERRKEIENGSGSSRPAARSVSDRMDTSKLPEAKVIEYTVSYTFDTHKDGGKRSHFMSMKFQTERPVTDKEAEALAFASSVTVTRSVIYQALARGTISVDEANELISNMKENHEHIYAKKLGPAVGDEGQEKAP